MPSALLEHGAEPDYQMLNETGIVTKTLVWTPQRDTVAMKNANDQTVFISKRDPRLELKITGVAVANGSGALEGLAVVHPGAAYAFANYGTGVVVHQFTFATGNKLIVDSVTQSHSEEKEPEIDVTATFWPAIANADLDGDAS